MNFRNELRTLINKYSMENGSNTPDFILADYLIECFLAFDKATKAREEWYGREVKDSTARLPRRDAEVNNRDDLKQGELP